MTTFEYTCMACFAAFESSDLQREHYKTDWHRYNLKRKVADLPPLSYEAYLTRLAQEKIEEATIPDEKRHCGACR